MKIKKGNEGICNGKRYEVICIFIVWWLSSIFKGKPFFQSPPSEMNFEEIIEKLVYFFGFSWGKMATPNMRFLMPQKCVSTIHVFS